jgi:phospholipid/cholesterol/gamma-HCH transport system permease protein
MSNEATVQFEPSEDGTLLISFAGDWLLGPELPRIRQMLAQIHADSPPQTIEFSCDELGMWDTGLITALSRLYRLAETLDVEVVDDGLPGGVRKLLTLAFLVKEREGARRAETESSFLEKTGQASLNMWRSGTDLVHFLGELIQSFGRLFRGTAAYQKSDLSVAIQEAGAESFPIVGLICFLIGMIFAFVGVMQLENFGAGIYTADLVAVAMVREMAPIMTAIIMAGRTGAAYAAHIGTMKVNEEIDALTTMGIDPMDYLVLPRTIGLVMMMPLLTMYGSLLGIAGGMLVGLAMLDVSLIQYAVQTGSAVDLSDLFGGLFKALVYGSLVAVAGCQQGMACGNSAMAVGQSTTQAVVMGIVLIVVSASIMTIIYINLGI